MFRQRLLLSLCCHWNAYVARRSPSASTIGGAIAPSGTRSTFPTIPWVVFSRGEPVATSLTLATGCVGAEERSSELPRPSTTVATTLRTMPTTGSSGVNDWPVLIAWPHAVSGSVASFAYQRY